MNYKSFLVAVMTILSSQAFGQNEDFEMTQLLPNFSLSNPWEVLYGPDDMLWITERVGKSVVRIDPATGIEDELITINNVYQAAGQDGLLGMALHAELGQGTGNDYVYLSYTYWDNGRKQRIARYDYTVNNDNGSLSNEFVLIDDLPSSNDHNSGRLLFGPDSKLYYTIGDQGANQFANSCIEIESQSLPTQNDITAENWDTYQGKVLRMNLDGSIPSDNPSLNGVVSHVYSYGHRNPQGLVFGNNGKLYSDEHGPKSDDEINQIIAGKNYGWPHISGFQDNSAYTYCNYSSISNCQNVGYSTYSCPNQATETNETDFSAPNLQDPMKTMFTVPDNYNFQDPNCSSYFICWPTVAPSSLDIYEDIDIPTWQNSLLVVSLKKGKIFKYDLSSDGNSIVGDSTGYWYTQNRYRDMAIDPDGKTFYVITDNSGQTSGPSGSNTSNLTNPGTILKFEFQSAVLPLTYQAFEVARNGVTVELDWQTENEVNTSYFEIQRSLDNKTFTNIGRVEATGQKENEYLFEDEEPYDFVTYYRLKQVDYDGRYSYSEVKVVDQIQKSLFVKVYPNPADEILFVDLNFDNQEDIAVELYNNIGQLVLATSYRLNGGKKLNIAHLQTGLYFLHVKANRKEYRQAVMIR